MSKPQEATLELLLHPPEEREMEEESGDGDGSEIDDALDALLACLEGDSAGRKETRAWLAETFATAKVDPEARPCRIMSSGIPRERGIIERHALQFSPPCYSSKGLLLAKGTGFTLLRLQVVCEHSAGTVGKCLAEETELWRNFFDGDDERISAFFGGFSATGNHEGGARALARYALTNRQSVWSKLKWRGKHSQAPVVVAAKPHYLTELDAVATVRRLLRDDSHFWRSQELKEELASAFAITLDTRFFASELMHRYRGQRGRKPSVEAKHLLRQCLAQPASRAAACRRGLNLLPPRSRRDVIDLLAGASVKCYDEPSVDVNDGMRRAGSRLLTVTRLSEKAEPERFTALAALLLCPDKIAKRLASADVEGDPLANRAHRALVHSLPAPSKHFQRRMLLRAARASDLNAGLIAACALLALRIALLRAAESENQLATVLRANNVAHTMDSGVQEGGQKRKRKRKRKRSGGDVDGDPLLLPRETTFVLANDGVARPAKETASFLADRLAADWLHWLSDVRESKGSRP